MTVIVGIDPHKASHTAVAIDRDEQRLAEIKVRATIQQATKQLAPLCDLARHRKHPNPRESRFPGPSWPLRGARWLVVPGRVECEVPE